MAVQEGIAYWTHATTPNTRYTPEYSVDLVVSDDVADSFRERGFAIKDYEEGPALKFRRKVNGPNGMIRKAPALMDAQKATLDCLVGNGSKVRVQARPWEINRNGQDFKGLELQAVQVIDLIEYRGADGDELDAVDSDEKEVDEL